MSFPIIILDDIIERDQIWKQKLLSNICHFLAVQINRKKISFSANWKIGINLFKRLDNFFSEK